MQDSKINEKSVEFVFQKINEKSVEFVFQKNKPEGFETKLKTKLKMKNKKETSGKEAMTENGKAMYQKKTLLWAVCRYLQNGFLEEGVEISPPPLCSFIIVM
jgi:hypothetical protein